MDLAYSLMALEGREMRVLLCVMIVFLSGCEWQVDCDSGFTTGPHSSASITKGGVIVYGGEFGEKSSRMMAEGETCTRTRI